jgi:hypothetical protein
MHVEDILTRNIGRWERTNNSLQSTCIVTSGLRTENTGVAPVYNI